MAFDIDLSNWAIDFRLQDEALAWSRKPLSKRFPSGVVSIAWPPSGEQGLKRAYLEGVPLYMLTYSHQTTEKIIKYRLLRIAVIDHLNGTPMEEVCSRYNVSQEQVIKGIPHYLEIKRAEIYRKKN